MITVELVMYSIDIPVEYTVEFFKGRDFYTEDEICILRLGEVLVAEAIEKSALDADSFIHVEEACEIPCDNRISAKHYFGTLETIRKLISPEVMKEMAWYGWLWRADTINDFLFLRSRYQNQDVVQDVVIAIRIVSW